MENTYSYPFWNSRELSVSEVRKISSEDDLENVKVWFDVENSESLRFEYENESIEKFEKDIKEQIEILDEFPNDEKRVRKIIEEIDKTGKLYPIFVRDGFTIEGRHRQMAFFLLGIETIPVVYITKKRKSNY